MPTSEDESLEIRLLLEGIASKYGYDFRGYATDSLRRRVLMALTKSGAGHLGELQHRVLTDADAFAAVLDDLTVRVTELFREPAQYRALRARVVPVLKTYPAIKVWHAGCASGEEVYATAIMLAEEQLLERAMLYGTDLSQKALEQAKAATYPAELLQSFRKNHEASGSSRPLSDHFVEAYGGVAFNEALKRNVVFFQHSLATDHAFGQMHLVFCRNVLIYFGAQLRARVLDTIANSLSPGGFLCLGSSERLRREEMQGQFSPFDEEARIYRCEGRS